MSDDLSTQTTPPAEPPKAPEFKKDASAKVVISEDEFKSLEAKVLAAKKVPSEEDVYKKALDEIRAEMSATQKQSLEEAAKAEQARLIAEMSAKIAALESRPQATSRKGVAAVPNQQQAEGLIRKTADGKYAIPMSEIERATKEVMFKHRP